MALIPEDENTTRNLIFKSWEKKADLGFREHLGASIIGGPCNRQIWYSWRWVTLVKHPGRLLRLFNRGQREEPLFIQELNAIGVETSEIDNNTGEQWQWSTHAGHFGGSGDGIAISGVPEAPKSVHILEFKTHNDKSFKELTKKGVLASKPQHYAQMQVYMGLSSIDRALYMAVNKNDDDLYTERVKFDPKDFEQLIERARVIIESPEPPAKISDDPGWYQCSFCDHKTTCHSTAAPVPTCRSCVHSTPRQDGDCRWYCEKFGTDLDKNMQISGCQSHAYIPALLSNWAEATDAIDDSIEFTVKSTGNRFLNGPPVDFAVSYSSAEVYRANDKTMLGDKGVDMLKKDFNGELIETKTIEADE